MDILELIKEIKPEYVILAVIILVFFGLDGTMKDEDERYRYGKKERNWKRRRRF